MARRGKIGYKRKVKNKVRLEKKGSDESDEDYKVDEDEEFYVSEDDYCSSLAEDELVDSLIEFQEEEEQEWFENKVKKVGGPSVRKGSQPRMKNVVVKRRNKKVVYSDDDDEEEYDNYGFSRVRQRKKNRVSRKEEEDDDDDFQIFRRQEEDEFVDEKPRKKSRVSKTEIYEDSYNENQGEKDIDSYQEENEDGNYDDSDDEDDKEFTPSEVMMRTRRKPVKKRVLRRRNRSSPIREIGEKNLTSRKNNTIRRWGWGRKRKSNLNSDSGFVSSESSDYEYTISEEEREQVREATEYCRRLTTSTVKMIEKEELLPSKRQRPGRKGKQKVVDMNSEVRNQVCGICLSEEGKRTVRGVLNCCNHYFCFACIMEWSKVESRCPLCKQRFITISRSGRAGSSRDEVFSVPKRDQVYQPSEEELRGYVDPYENVLCNECHQGGDDGFMLLCDLCDSPAHTYCVGLGYEIPDGNWYCDGCRPTALAPTLTPDDQGASNDLSSPVREIFDLNEAYVPDTPLTPASGHSQSPRRHHSQASGPVAFTLYARRRILRHINALLNNRSRQPDTSNMSRITNLFSSQHTTVMPESVIYPDINAPPSFYSSRIGNLRGEALQSRASMSAGTEFSGTNRRIVSGLSHQQLHPCCGTSNTQACASTTSYQFKEHVLNRLEP